MDGSSCERWTRHTDSLAAGLVQGKRPHRAGANPGNNTPGPQGHTTGVFVYDPGSSCEISDSFGRPAVRLPRPTMLCCVFLMGLSTRPPLAVAEPEFDVTLVNTSVEDVARELLALMKVV